VSASVDLSILIVNWNSRELLRSCLASVAEQRQMLSRMMLETIVVDNASHDASVGMVRTTHPNVLVVENESNMGFAAANNQAILRSSGRYLLLLNPDTQLRPNALSTLIAFMDAHPQAGAAGPQLLNSDGTLQKSCSPMLTPFRELWRLAFLDAIWRKATYPLNTWDRSVPRQVDVIKGAAFLLRREALDQVGLLDEDFFVYSEEVDLCMRLGIAGWERWWVPQATVIHHEAGSTSQVVEAMFVELYRSKVRFCRKYYDASAARLFTVALWLLYAPRLIVATVASAIEPTMSLRASKYRRLMSELGAM